MRERALALAALALLGVGQARAAQAPPAPARPNVVLIVIDDIGVEKIGAYGLHPAGARGPCTPNIDALAAEGLLFLQAWADPVCSPTRAQILTGRHGFRTGIGTIIEHDGDQLGLSAVLETTLPEILTGYDSSLAGKWHLAHPTHDGLRHPVECGFRWYGGTLFNIATPPIACGPDCKPPECKLPLGYTSWVETRAVADRPGATQENVTRFATSVTTDEALARAAAMRAPWFLEVAYNAAHLPAELPPAELAPPGECALSAPKELDRAGVINAMIEALDTEIGRLVAGLRKVDPSVVILLIGDNGTSIPGAEGSPGSCFARGRSKGSVYQGGVRVPLVAAGPKVARGKCDALVSAADLFATIAELAGVESHAPDSVSLVPYLAGDPTPRRSTVYAETFTPNFVSPDKPGQPRFAPTSHERAIRDARYKLIRVTGAKTAAEEHLFDLVADPCEEHDLLAELKSLADTSTLKDEARIHLEALRAELSRLGVYE